MRDATPLSMISAVVLATDQEELFRAMQSAAQSLGFERALFGIQIKRPFLDPLQHVVSGWPEPYQVLYGEREFVGRDPTVAYCQTHTTPLVWSESMYEPGSFEIMEESRRFGLGYGISVPVHENTKTKSMLSLARDKAFDPASGEGKILSDGALVLANCLHIATARITVPELLALQAPKLTPRELEVLKWAGEGKSSAVIGDLLNISQAAVNFHTMNLYRKLNVATRLQAVSKAVALGLIA
jgi:DNA-binding CsgD family transcriptional regulator